MRLSESQSLASSSTGSARAALHEWLNGVPGRLVVESELRHLQRLLPDMFGYYLVQVGRLGGFDLIANSRILQRVVVEIDGDATATRYPVVLGTATALPVDSHSVDVVVMPHILEFEAQPHEALRESLRVLVPEGHLVLCGFNPWSFLGLRQVLGRRRAAPWSGHFLSLSRIKDWLALLGFDVLALESCFFRPPFSDERVQRRLRFIDLAGRAAWPYFAGAYVVVARKRITTLTPLRPRWQPRRRLVAVGLTGPSPRGVPKVAGR